MRTKTGHVVVAMVALLAASGCRDHEERPAEAAESAGPDRSGKRVVLSEEAFKSLDLRFARAEERDLSPTLKVTAVLAAPPDRRAEVGSPVSGRIVEVRANVGDRVARGDVLALIVSPEAGRARAGFLQAVARRDVARKARDREAQLFEGRATSARELEEAEGALRVAEADVAAARAVLATYGLGPRSGAADPARIALASPIGGVVTARAALVGRFVQPSDSLFEVSDPAEMWLIADVFEQDLRLVTVGEPVEIEVPAWPDEVFEGRVDRVGDVLDPTSRTVKVRVVLPNSDGRLKAGMFATARIHGAHDHAPRRMLVVPWAAIQRVDDHPVVFERVGDREFEMRRVHTGDRAGPDVEVLSGLEPGVVVVGDGSFLLKGEMLKGTLGGEE